MSRPFPGMDPYLEIQPFWSDFAPRFLSAIGNSLLPQLLPKYDVRIEEYVFVTHEEVRLHRLRPDVTISSTGKTGEFQRGTAAAVAEPTAVELDYPDIEPRKQRHLKLVQRFTGQVVTVIELLSPANKTPGEDGLDAYLEKRGEILASRCHLIELDLLRSGERLPMSGPLPAGDYFAYVGRVGRRPRCRVIGWTLRSRLPVISVPLLPGDPDVPLDLDAVFQAAYEPSLYDRRLPYDQPIEPPLADADRTWVAERLQELAGR